jgi:hypothetical protein
VNVPGPIGTPVAPVLPGSGPTTVASGTAGTTPGLTAIPTVRLPNGFQEALQDLLQGIEAVIPDGGSLAAVNGTYTKTAMVAQLESALTLYGDVSAQETALLSARIALKAGIPAVRQYYAELKGVLTGFYHAGNPVLAQFGFKPKKAPAVQTTAEKAVAVVKRTETRQLRGTMGKKEKQALKYTGPVTAAGVPSAGSEASPAVSPPKPAGQ